MARKHNTKHQRSRSRYKERLAARGLSRTPPMIRFDAEILAACHRREGKLTALDYFTLNHRGAA